MQELINITRILTEQSHQTHIEMSVDITKEYKRMMIEFSYDKKFGDNDVALHAIEKHFEQIYQEQDIGKMNAEDFLPVENLITLSVDVDGEYIGARHCKDTNQVIEISEANSSLGFSNTKVTKGVWHFVFSCHALLSKELTLQCKVGVE